MHTCNVFLLSPLVRLIASIGRLTRITLTPLCVCPICIFFSLFLYSLTADWPTFNVTEHGKPTWSLQDYRVFEDEGKKDAQASTVSSVGANAASTASASASASTPSSASTSSNEVTRTELVHLANLTYLPYPSDDAALIRDVNSLIRWTGTIQSFEVQAEQMYSPLESERYYQRGLEEQQVSNTSERADSSLQTATQEGNTTLPSATADAAITSDATPASALRLRPDVVTDGDLATAVLANAPYKQRGFFVVPKVGTLEDS